jgi:hypothetical protein
MPMESFTSAVVAKKICRRAHKDYVIYLIPDMCRLLDQ